MKPDGRMRARTEKRRAAFRSPPGDSFSVKSAFAAGDHRFRNDRLLRLKGVRDELLQNIRQTCAEVSAVYLFQFVCFQFGLYFLSSCRIGVIRYFLSGRFTPDTC